MHGDECFSVCVCTCGTVLVCTKGSSKVEQLLCWAISN